MYDTVSRNRHGYGSLILTMSMIIYTKRMYPNAIEQTESICTVLVIVRLPLTNDHDVLSLKMNDTVDE